MKGPARLQLGLAFVVFGIAAFLAFRVHAFFIWPKGLLVGFDERYLAPFGLRMLAGESLPFVDAVSHRGPLLYWIVALFQKLLGPFDWASLRWLALVFTWLTMGAAFLVGLVANRPLAGAFAALFFAYVTTCALDIGAGMGVTGELVAAPFSLMALAMTAFAIERSKPDWRFLFFLLGGAFAGLASLSKQTSLSIILPLAVFTLFASNDSSRPFFSFRPSFRYLKYLFAGFAIPIVAVLGIYAYKDALGSLWYWFYAYNARIYMEPYARGSELGTILDRLHGEPLLTLALALPILTGLLLPLTRARSFSPRELAQGFASHGLEATVALQTALALLLAFLPLRFWPHYFVSVLPFVGLLVGIRLDSMLGPPSRWPSVLSRSLMMLALSGWVFAAHRERLSFLNGERAKGHFIDKRSNAVCSAVEKYSRKGEPIFIWGFDGDFYIDCRRLPASRFVFTTFVAGVVPPFWKETKPSRIVPGSRERLEAELRSSRPPLILDFDESLGDGTSMREIPQLGRLLEEDYCQLEDVRARGRRAGVWVRREGGGCGGTEGAGVGGGGGVGVGVGVGVGKRAGDNG